MARLICVSNRIPLGPEPSGGLVVALADVLAETGGIWIGAGAERPDMPSECLQEIPGGPFRRLAFDLTEVEWQGYYNGHSNSVLWPILHSRADLMEIAAGELESYKAVNRRIARLMMSQIRPDDLIWVHDFHLIPLASELRALGARNRIGFFLHTPFPGSFDTEALPNSAETCEWLMDYDLVGLQSRRDVRKFRSSLAAVLEAEQAGPEIMRHGDKTVRVLALPISIDVAEFQTIARDEPDRLPKLIVRPDRELMIGVDRLDYSKGIPQRFRAFDAFLRKHEDWHRRVSLLQISPPTREGLKAYDAIRDETETLAGRINGAYSDLAWVPIRYIHRSLRRETLAGLYRVAQVGLVTPLMDGMNLVAKEFVSSRTDEQGVLVLSTFTGAARELVDAVLINPYDREQTSDALHEALTMPPAERQRRMARLRGTVQVNNIFRWAGKIISELLRFDFTE